MGRELSKREKWTIVAAGLILIAVFLPWWKGGMINPATRLPNPPRFGWTNTMAWLAALDAILLVALLQLDVVGKQVFTRYAIGAALGALCLYMGLLGIGGAASGTSCYWWPAFLLSIGLVAVGFAPEETVNGQARAYVYMVGMAVVVGLCVGVALKAYTYGQILLVIGGFVAYLVNIGYAKEHYPEFQRLRKDEPAR